MILQDRQDGDRRHILFLLPNLQGGGAERVIVTLLRFLDRSRFRLTLAVVDSRQAVYLKDVPPDVEVVDLGCTRVRQAIPGIIRLIWKGRPDLVFSTLGHLNLPLGMVRWALPPRTRLVGREGTILGRMLEDQPNRTFWRWAYRVFYRRFDRIICQSRAMQEDLIASVRVPPEKLVLVHNPVDLDRIRTLAGEDGAGDTARPGSVRLVAAGRLSPEKGFDVLIEALALVGDPRYRLTLLGDGPLRSDLERLVTARGLDHQVVFLGFQKNPYPYLKNADAFVLSSKYEGFPNVVLEAMACGTPVISTPLGAVQEIFEKIPNGGLLTRDFGAPSMAEALTSVGYLPRLPPDAVSPFQVPVIVGQYAQLLDEVGNPGDSR